MTNAFAVANETGDVADEVVEVGDIGVDLVPEIPAEQRPRTADGALHFDVPVFRDVALAIGRQP